MRLGVWSLAVFILANLAWVLYVKAPKVIEGIAIVGTIGAMLAVMIWLNEPPGKGGT